jgi:hypothetical protein
MKFKLDAARWNEVTLLGDKLGYEVSIYPKVTLIKQDEFFPVYEIEIDTLEELYNFIKKFGQCIINENEIMIYNSWVE